MAPPHTLRREHLATIQHNLLTTSELHEPKGIDSATAGQVYFADGAGSGQWATWPSGWGHYVHTGQLNVDITPSLLQINGLGSNTNTTYLPKDATEDLWNTATNRIRPVALGDSYTVRVNLPVTGEVNNPREISLILDIQDGNSFVDAIPITQSFALTGRTTPYTYSINFTIFALNTFVANGGQFWLATDSHSVTITDPSILINRTHGPAV